MSDLVVFRPDVGNVEVLQPVQTQEALVDDVADGVEGEGQVPQSWKYQTY